MLLTDLKLPLNDSASIVSLGLHVSRLAPSMTQEATGDESVLLPNSVSRRFEMRFSIALIYCDTIPYYTGHLHVPAAFL